MCFFCCWGSVASPRFSAMPCSATATRGLTMLDYFLGGLTLAVLLGYLTYALVKPEKF